MREYALHRIWRDTYVPGAPLSYRFVSPPQPLHGADHSRHVLLIQNPKDSFASGLITLIDQVSGSSRQLVTTSEVDLPIELLIGGLGLARRCLGPASPCSCSVWSGVHPLQHGDSLSVCDGHHLLLLASLRPWTLLQDSTGFGLQLRTDYVPSSASSRVAAFDIPGDPPEQAQFCLNPAAVPFLPVQPLLSQQDEFIQDLHVEWLFNAWAWEDEEPTCVAAVWFVDHRWTHPHGTQFRKVRLWPDFLAWYYALESAWIDQRDPETSLELHIVQPRPPNEDAGIKIHVILIQHPKDDWVTSLVSFMDISATPFLAIQLAITTHELILLDNILRVCRLYEACTQSPITIFCAA